MVDLSPSLCEVARKRFERLGWDFVHVLCADAETFQVGVKADLITMSYSLSMIPNYFKVIDRAESLLSPKGIIGVADFYVSQSVDTPGIDTGDPRHVNWISRHFWKIW